MSLRRVVVTALVFLAGLVVLPATASALKFSPSPGSPINFGFSNVIVNGIAADDLNGDEKDDLVMVGKSNRIWVQLANQEGTGFVAAPGSPYGMGAADTFDRFQVFTGNFGGSATTDLMVVSASPVKYETYLGQGGGVFGSSPDFTLNAPQSDEGVVVETRPATAVGDFNNDDWPDIVSGMSDHHFAVALGSSTGQFTVAPGGSDGFNLPSVTNSESDSYDSVAVGHWNGDGNLDIAFTLDSNGVSGGSPDGVYIAYGNGDGTFTPETAGNPLGGQLTTLGTVAAIKLDDTGLDRLSYTETAPSRLDTIPWVATGVTFGTGAEPLAQTVADLDLDGDDDVAVALQGARAIGVVERRGNLQLANAPGSPFALPAIGNDPFEPESIAVGDFNGDGAPDLASDSGNVTDSALARGVEVLLAQPDPVVSPTSVSFPDTPVNESVGQTFTLRNQGTVPVTMTGITDTAPDGGFVTYESGCAQVPPVNPGESCQFTVVFHPTEPGTFSGQTDITFSGGITVTATYSGRTGPQQATPNRTSVEYGEATSGYLAGAKTESVVFTSTGGAPLELGVATLTGPDTDSFQILNPDSCDVAIAPGDSCTLNVRFQPPAEAGGLREANVEFPDSNDPGLDPLPLSGYGRQAEYTVTPRDAEFGEVKAGATSAPQTFTLQSTGQAMVPFDDVVLAGTNADSFTIASENCPDMVPVSGSCEIKVTFTPKAGTTAGKRSATLLVSAFSSGPDLDQPPIALTGTATSDPLPPPPPPPPPSGDPVLSLKLKSPGKVKRGKTLELKATVKNTGNGAAEYMPIKTVVPKKFAKAPKAITVRSLAPGASIIKAIKVKVKKKAKKGKKFKVKVIVTAPGATKRTASRTIKVT